MCAFDRKAPFREWPARRKAALVATLVPIFSSSSLLLGARHGVSDAVLGLVAGIGIGFGVLLLTRSRVG